MTKLLDELKFINNPFASYSAESEPEIERYFVRPPYYEYIKERGTRGQSVILFGSRGAGKSATRITLAKENMNADGDAKQRPLTITLDDFSRVLEAGLEAVNFGMFATEIGYLVVESLLVWLATQPEEERTVTLQTMNPQEEALTISLVQHFYLTRPEHLRQLSVREPLKLLKQAWRGRAKHWLTGKWDAVASLVGALAQAIVAKTTGDTTAPVATSLSALLKADSSQWNDTQFGRSLLLRFVDLVRIFGFSGVTVLVDKADETPQTSTPRSTAKLLFPLLANTQLLEVDGFAWLFFLWDKVRPEYATDALPVRLDKIPNATIAWDNAFLANLAAERLKHFSNAHVQTFTELCDPSVSADTAFTEIIRSSMRSPRELIRVLDTVVREHDDEYSIQASPPRLLQSSIDRGLDKYAVETLLRTFDRVHLQQIARLRMSTFINKDVQHTFRINDASARNRIRAWADAGIVSQTGTRQADGGGAGKPSYEYSVTDFRVRRFLDRDLQLGADFEGDEDAEEPISKATSDQ